MSTNPLLSVPSKPSGEKLSSAELADRSALKDKIVLITGCTNGLGAACLDEMCNLPAGERPAKIVLVARNAELCAQKASIIKAAGIESSTYLAELTDVSQILRVAKEVKDGEVKLDTVCLNAGMWQTHAERKAQADGFEVHYVANFLQQCIFAQEWASMIPKGGRVVVMGSFTGFSISKGQLDFEHLGTKEGEHKMMLNGAIPYSQSKLMQHMWAKHVALHAPLAEGVTLNVCCPGSVMTKIDTWQALLSCVGCCYEPCVKPCLGIREPDVGCTSMMFSLGSQAMEGVTGSFVDFGADVQRIIPFKPAPLEYYPSQKMALAPSTADAAQCERLFSETSARVAELKAKYA